METQRIFVDHIGTYVMNNYKGSLAECHGPCCVASLRSPLGANTALRHQAAALDQNCRPAKSSAGDTPLPHLDGDPARLLRFPSLPTDSISGRRGYRDSCRLIAAGSVCRCNTDPSVGRTGGLGLRLEIRAGGESGVPGKMRVGLRRPRSFARPQVWWAAFCSIFLEAHKKSGSPHSAVMRNTWWSPRTVIWEYWTALSLCLLWIQYSCGMPHVIRIGKHARNHTWAHFICVGKRLSVIIQMSITCKGITMWYLCKRKYNYVWCL